jgi:uncharacterized protein (TIGR02118 family)
VHELVALGTDSDAGRNLAADLGGVAYVADASERRDLPFRSLVRVATDDIARLAPAADLGTYLIYARQVASHPRDRPAGEPTPGVVAAFGLFRHPRLTHAEADAHWRDVHAPLALRHHPGMWDYVQCSVVHTFAGPSYDGFALCGFASDADLRDRFFDGPEGRAVILDDIGKFADTKASPRRVLATEWDFRR